MQSYLLINFGVLRINRYFCKITIILNHMNLQKIQEKLSQKLWWKIGCYYMNKKNPMKQGLNNNITNWHTLGNIIDYNEPTIKIEQYLQLIIAHTFWQGEIDIKQIFCLKSFIGTQNMNTFEIWLWLDENSYKLALRNTELLDFQKKCKNKIILKRWNVYFEIKNTPFEKITWYFKWERSLPYIADDFRIISLYKYGGLYFDMDIMFCKDLSSLIIRNEFVYAWEKQPFANNAILFLRKDSHIANEIAKLMIKNKSSQPWSIFNYKNKSLSKLTVYPCSLFDPLWNGYIEGMPLHDFNDFFREFDNDFKKSDLIKSYKNFFPGIFAYHWHNMWENETYEDSYFGLFNKEFNSIVKNLTM